MGKIYYYLYKYNACMINVYMWANYGWRRTSSNALSNDNAGRTGAHRKQQTRSIAIEICV